MPRRIPVSRLTSSCLRRTATSSPPPPPPSATGPTQTVYTPGKNLYRPKANSPPPRPPPEEPFRRKGPDGEAMMRSLGPATLFAVGLGIGFGYATDASASLHSHVLMPIVRATMDAEGSHRFAINFLRWGGFLRPFDKRSDTENTEVDLLGYTMTNPIGLAAGFDKNAEAIDPLFALGFGYVEIGSVTPEPQAGNPKPRFFRLPEDDAVINRYGFNSDGHDAVLKTLQKRLTQFYKLNKPLITPNHDYDYPFPPQNINRSLHPNKLLGINLGKNKTSPEDSDEDYLEGVRTFGPYADVLVINVSSPNTPGLRLLQGGGRLETLLKAVVKEKDDLSIGSDGRRPRVLVKVAPDLGEEQIIDIALAVKSSGVDGVVVSNTTITRPESLKSANKTEVGGLSGPPVKPLALAAVRALRSQLPPLTPIIGCGGISSGADVLDFVEAGASAVQLYTYFGYQGVGAARKIKNELELELEKRDKTFKTMVWERRQKEVENQGIANKAKGLSAKVADKVEQVREKVIAN